VWNGQQLIVYVRDSRLLKVVTWSFTYLASDVMSFHFSGEVLLTQLPSLWSLYCLVAFSLFASHIFNTFLPPKG